MTAPKPRSSPFARLLSTLAPGLPALCGALALGCSTSSSSTATDVGPTPDARADSGPTSVADTQDASALPDIAQDATTATQDAAPDVPTPPDAGPDDVQSPPDVPPPIDSPYSKAPSVVVPQLPLEPPIPATVPAGPYGAGTWVVPNGRVLRPAGTQVELQSYPMGAVVHPNGKTLYVSGNGDKNMEIIVVDVTVPAVVQRVERERLYRFLVLDAAGAMLYASGGPKAPVQRFPILETGLLGEPTELAVPAGLYGLALSPDQSTLYGLKFDSSQPDELEHALDAIDLGTGESKGLTPVGRIPYDLVMAPAGDALYLTAWQDGTVERVAVPSGVVTTLQVGHHPQGLALSADGARLYASVTDSDTVVAIDTATMTRVGEVAVNLAAAAPPGENPVGEAAPLGRDPGFMALSPDGARLYVACAMSNEVMVVDTATMSRVGTVPAGWYPAAVAVSPDGGTLYVVNSKGTGIVSPWVLDSVQRSYVGTLSVVPVPDDATLAANVNKVLAQNLGVSGRGRIQPTPDVAALLPTSGRSPQIEHVVYIVRENKTFDVELGDMATPGSGITGDPSLTLFGEQYTPNLHKLAREYCLLDNFYSDGDYSATGHSYAAASKPSDYIEKFEGISDYGIDGAWGVTDPSVPGHGFFFANIMAHGLTVRSFGEAVGMIDSFHFESVLDPFYPGLVFNLEVPDMDRAEYFAEWIQNNELPNFTFLILPVNHTCCGGDPDHVSPASMVADNDEATGRIVEALSQSPEWEKTVVFVFEDDPQDGGDSVYYHRSPLVVISPWAKRGYVNKTHHATGSIHATMEAILGVSPLTELDAFASPIYDCFTGTKDTTPYAHQIRLYPRTTNSAETPVVDMKRFWQRMDFDEPDENVGLGRVLWKQYKGTDAPWPKVRFTPRGNDIDD